MIVPKLHEGSERDTTSMSPRKLGADIGAMLLQRKQFGGNKLATIVMDPLIAKPVALLANEVRRQRSIPFSPGHLISGEEGLQSCEAKAKCANGSTVSCSIEGANGNCNGVDGVGARCIETLADGSTHVHDTSCG